MSKSNQSGNIIIIIIIIIIITNFNMCLLTCKLNSTSAYYKASTKIKKTQICKNAQNKTLSQHKKLGRKKYYGIKDVKKGKAIPLRAWSFPGSYVSQIS
jgi:hypothetical protein